MTSALVRRFGALVRFDREGLPIQGSTDRWSPYYYDLRDVWLEFNGRSVDGMRVFEFNVEEGWLGRVSPITGRDERIYGRVRAFFRPPTLGLIVQDQRWP